MDLLEQLGGRRDDMVKKNLDSSNLFYGLRVEDLKLLMSFTDLRDPDFDALCSLLQHRPW